MKEMVYKKQHNGVKTILDEGFYKDYEYIILSLNTHPCAYICLDEKSIFYKKSYDDIPIDVHGGLTFAYHTIYRVLEYSDKYKCDTVQRFTRDWIIGWDYAHLGDWFGLAPSVCDKKWTTMEIKDEVKDAINQLIDLEEK